MAHPPRIQGITKGRDVDKFTAIIVDQHRALVEARQHLRADESCIGIASGLRILLAEPDMDA